MPPLKVSVYSRNNSVSDILLGEGEVDTMTLLEDFNNSHIITIYDVNGSGKIGGSVSIQFEHEFHEFEH